jgi:hypothetical protein
MSDLSPNYTPKRTSAVCASVEVERLGHAFESDEKVATAEATMRP